MVHVDCIHWPDVPEPELAQDPQDDRDNGDSPCKGDAPHPAGVRVAQTGTQPLRPRAPRTQLCRRRLCQRLCSSQLCSSQLCSSQLDDGHAIASTAATAVSTATAIDNTDGLSSVISISARDILSFVAWA